MEYSALDIQKKLKIKRQNLKYFRQSIPLIEGMDFYFIEVDSKRLYKYRESGFKKLQSRRKRKI